MRAHFPISFVLCFSLRFQIAISGTNLRDGW